MTDINIDSLAITSITMTRSDALNAVNHYVKSMDSMIRYNARRAFHYIERLDYSIHQIKTVKLVDTTIEILLDDDTIATFKLIPDDILPLKNYFISDAVEMEIKNENK